MEHISKKLKALACQYTETLKIRFGNNLSASILFGSVARKEAGGTSDIDLFLIFKDLPKGRMARRDILGDYPPEIEKTLAELRKEGIYTDIVEHIRTEKELERKGSPFLYELAQDGISLYDPKGVFAALQQKIFDRMKVLGSQFKKVGRFRYLDLKPDYKPNEVFEI